METKAMLLDYPMVTLAEIKRIYGAGEYRHFFDPDTLRFFGGTLPQNGWRTDKGIYFITSETEPEGVARFTVRLLPLEGGRIDTIGQYRGWPNFGQARAAMVAHMKLPAEQEARDGT